MYNSEFEKQVQEKMEELRMAPSASLWSRIEQDLPPHTRRRRYLLLLAALLLLTGIVWTVQHFSRRPDTAQTFTKTAANTATKEIAASAPGSNTHKTAPANPPAAQPGNTIPADQPAITVSVPAAPATGAGTGQEINAQRQGKAPAVTSISSSAGEPQYENDVQQRSKTTTHSRASTRVSINAPAPQQDTETDVPISTAMLNSLPEYTAIPLPATGRHVNLALWPGKKAAMEKDLSAGAVAAVQQRHRTGWQPVVSLAAGLSRQVSSPIELSPVNSAYTQGGGVQPAVADSFILAGSKARVRPSLAFDAGGHLRRQLSSKWAVQAGVSYSYQSYLRTVGRFIDSSGSFYNNNTQVGYINFYRAATAADNQTYTNRLHWLQLPAEVQYSPGKNGRLQLLGGMTLGYLAGSNALISRYGSGGFVNSSSAYNKLRLSLHTGTAYRIGSRLPLTAGIRFSFDATPFIKREIGGQYVMASSIFISMPLKK